MNAAACRDVAFDTVIMVKQTPRRMLAAVQEVCGGRVLVPDETAREAKTHCAGVRGVRNG